LEAGKPEMEDRGGEWVDRRWKNGNKNGC